MPEAVRDCFPDVPEKCLFCPALIEAALNLYDHQAGVDGSMRLPPGVPAQVAHGAGVDGSAGLGQLLGEMAEVSQMRRRMIRAIAKVLYFSCLDGVRVGLAGDGELPDGGRAMMRWCGSASPLADIVPGVYIEEPDDRMKADVQAITNQEDA